MRAYSAMDDLRDDANARGWLFGIARHVFLDDVRRNAVRRRLEPEAADSRASTDAPDQEEHLERRRAVSALERAVEALAPPKPEIVQLHYGAGLSVQDIAEALSMPASTVKTHLRRARAALRKAPALQEVTP